ncbi:MAG: 3-dehydroquinate synthase [Lachnospiraceae bacterium]|nr:3-dehydroquinate synthase [Lachnospiraceae bacterium]
MAKDIEVLYENKFCYNILIRNNFNDLLDSMAEIEGGEYRKVCVVTDSNVSKLYLDEVVGILRYKYNYVLTHIFEAGENNKQLTTINGLYQDLIENHFERKDLLIALGGGVVGDMTGFTAATYLRGIDFIQIPTTLLSQVDSSIGGKTGVDYMSYKNMVGAFYMPRLVYINISVLNTLPSEQLASGMGEVIKHGLIKNLSYYNYLKDNADNINDTEGKLDLSVMETIVYESCLIKKAVVEEDPKETGLRRILNYGHTLGHAIEKLSDFKLFHGHCVALGIVCALYISNERGLVTDSDVNDIKTTLNKYKLPCKLNDFAFTPKEVIDVSRSDKKMSGGHIKFVLTEGIGSAFVAEDVSEDEMLSAVKALMED